MYVWQVFWCFVTYYSLCNCFSPPSAKFLCCYLGRHRATKCPLCRAYCIEWVGRTAPVRKLDPMATGLEISLNLFPATFTHKYKAENWTFPLSGLGETCQRSKNPVLPTALIGYSPNTNTGKILRFSSESLGSAPGMMIHHLRAMQKQRAIFQADRKLESGICGSCPRMSKCSKIWITQDHRCKIALPWLFSDWVMQ